MKTMIGVAVVAIALTIWQLNSSGDDKQPPPKSPGDKSVTLKGKITCSKCELNDTKKCHTVLLVRDPDVKPNENDRDIVYYFDEASSKKHHKDVCEQGVNGTVEGTVTEKDGTKTITVTKLTFKGPPK